MFLAVGREDGCGPAGRAVVEVGQDSAHEISVQFSSSRAVHEFSATVHPTSVQYLPSLALFFLFRSSTRWTLSCRSMPAAHAVSSSVFHVCDVTCTAAASLLR